jgi:DNA-binding NarL/FixJ family response regulator
LDYLWIEALAEMTGRKCSADEQLLMFSKFSNKFNSETKPESIFMDKCRRTLGLSPRLNDILDCLLDSLSNKEISEKLNISHHTVADYVKQIFSHFMVSSRRELLAAIKSGRLLKKKNDLASDEPEEQLFAILSDLLTMDVNVCERRRYFFDHFMKLIEGTYYIWYESEFDASMSAPKALNILTNFTPQLQQLFFEAANDPKLTDPYMIPSIVYHIKTGEPAYIRNEIIDDETWYNSEYTKTYYEKAGTDHPMTYTVKQEGNQHCGILVYRKWKSAPFEVKHREFITNVFKRLPWLFLKETQMDKSLFANLTSRQHKALLFIIDGYGKKELADHLCISENSANEYIKNIYKTFKVKSYGELMKLFMH